MNRRHLLVTYDISDDKRRNSVFQLLEANGDHTQYSVFLCQLNATELAFLRASMQPMINEGEDQILILDLGRVEYGTALSVETLGKAYAPPVRSMIV
jgi:CRISPR-associated protein Cas2